MLSRMTTHKGTVVRDDDDPFNQSNKNGLWIGAKLRLNQAKQDARFTWRALTFRLTTLKRHFNKASLSSENGGDWQESEPNRNLSTTNQSAGRDLTTHAGAINEVSGIGTKPASVYNELEQATSHNNKKNVKGSSKKNNRFAFKDDEDPGIMSESETSATGNGANRRNARTKHHNGSAYPSSHSTYNVKKAAAASEKSLGLVFLHYQGETKRALLPDEIRTLDDARNLFLKAFPISLTPEYLQSSKVKVYIQDPTRQDVFYELDDLSEIKDRTVLKLHEQSRPLSPAPTGTASGLCLTPSSALYETSETIAGLKHQPTPIDSKAPAADGANLEPTNGAGPNSTAGPCLNSTENREINNIDCYHRSESDSGSQNGGYRTLGKFSTPSYSSGAQNPSNGGFERHYGTLDSSMIRSGDRERDKDRERERVRYSSAEPPSKPQRYFSNSLGTCNLNRGVNGTGRCSRSPPPAANSLHSNYGNCSESKIEHYGSSHERNYPNFGAEGQVYHTNSSDRSSSVSRCGSATPVIDEEARVRMMSMEKQLASLSSLVHSALMAKGVSETVYKDIEMLRREILGPQRDDASESGSMSRFSDLGSDHMKSSNGKYSLMSGRDYCSSAFRQTNGDSRLSFESHLQLKNAKKRVIDLQSDVKHLRRAVQLNAQTTNDVLKDSFDRIKLILNTNKHIQVFALQAHQQNLVEANPLLSDRSWVNQEQERYRSLMKKVDQDLSEFEKHVENLRQKVVNGERKIRLAEVETFTDSLTYIGRTAANLKTQFPSLQQRLKYVMGAEMEKVVREEKFLKDEPLRLDNALQRCKKLTGTMLTMKKLALVQDRSVQQNGNRERPASTTPQSSQNLLSTMTAPSLDQCSNVSVEAPPLPPPPKHYNSSAFSVSSPFRNSISGPVAAACPPKSASIEVLNGSAASGTPTQSISSNLLDTLLDELQTVTCDRTAESKSVPVLPVPVIISESAVDKNKPTLTIESVVGSSDTIKRSPKSSSSTAKFNGPLNETSSLMNNNDAGGADKQAPVVTTFDFFMSNRINGHKTLPGPGRNSESPVPIGPRLMATIRTERCHSVTPSPMATFDSSVSNLIGVRDPPPPPPRSSSRTVLNSSGGGNNLPYSGNNSLPYSGTEINDFKRELMKESGNGGRLNGAGKLQKFPPAEVKINTAESRTNWPMVNSGVNDSGNSLEPSFRPASRGAGHFPQPFAGENGPQQSKSAESAPNSRQAQLMAARDLFFKNGHVTTHSSEVEEKLPFNNIHNSAGPRVGEKQLYNGSQWI